MLICSGARAADSLNGYERLLLPVIGRSGHSFLAQMTIFNAGTADAKYYPAGCFPAAGCFYEIVPFPPQAVRKIGGIRADRETQFFYVTAGTELETSLTARDWNNRLITPGANIPVVRQKDLRTGRLSLLGIPHTVLDTFNARVTLRVYVPDALEPARFTVRVLWESEAGVLPVPPPPASVIDVTTSVRLDDPNGVPLTPGVARVDGFERFLPNWGLGDVRVEIEAHDPSLLFWAFITITNNQNQSIRVIVPASR